MTLAGASGDPSVATYWRTDTGLVTLGTLTGDSSSQALDISLSGSTIVGSSGGRAMRWSQEEGMVSLGSLDDSTISSVARAVSQDGSVIVGQAIGPSGPQAFIWDATNGMRSLETVLTQAGALIPNAHLTDAIGISADGNIIIGVATNEAGGPAFSWVSSTDTIASPTDVTTAFAYGPSRIVVSWSYNQTSPGYIVERKVGTDGSWEPLALVGPGTNSFTDQNIITTNYLYRVLTANVVGSAPSPAVEQWAYRRYLFQDRISGDLQVWFAAGTNLLAGTSISAPSLTEWRAAALGDLNKDGAPDVILQSSNGTVAALFLQDTNVLGSALIQSGTNQTWPPTNNLWKIVGCADYNGDSNPDLVWQHQRGYVSVSFLQETNVISRKLAFGGQPLPAGYKLRAIALFEGDAAGFNWDATPDFILQTPLTRPVVWRMHNLAHARTHWLAPLSPKKWQIVGACTFPRPVYRAVNDTDLLLQNIDGTVAIWPTYIANVYNVAASSVVPLSGGPAPAANWRLVGAYQ